MHRLLRALPLAACCLLVGCRPNPPAVGEGSACTLTYECPSGFVCREGKCAEVVVGARDAGGGGTGATGGGGGGGMTMNDAGASGGGGGAADAGPGDAGTRMPFAPSSYRRCRDDLECAVFGGNCLVELALSRPDDGGVDRVRISDLDPSFAVGEGVCTLACTADPRICDSIVVDGPNGQSAAFSCQVVYAGSSPYPEPAPAFPFAAALDATAMSRGVPFASVCRPPFQASVMHAETFCQPCTQDMQCGTGACFLERPAAMPASGSCVEPCAAAADCAFGFSCRTLPGSSNPNTYCVPTAGTCGRCRDGDGDLRGVGRCGPLDEPLTAVDCDDRNPVAYFDAANPGHAFPQVCGASDVNCNGLSDDAEQLGGEDHCAACGDTCVPRAGELPHSRRQCVARTSQASFACVAACEPGWADCDGDVDTGCETQLGANQIWAEDADGDGRGAPTNFQYVCAGATPPAGWVQNRLDCNDRDPSIFGGDATLAAAAELCDGKDNNCNGVADDPGFIAREGEACTTTFPGVCNAGLRRCQGAGTASASLDCVPGRDPVAQATVAETCNGLDDNCNGQTDEGVDYFEAQGQENPNGSGAPVACTIPTALGICAQGQYRCVTQTNPLIDGGTRVTGVWSCDGNDPQPTDAIDENAIDSNCDGTDGDLSTAVFVRPRAGQGTLDGNDANDGTRQRPVATLQAAIARACPQTGLCRDIYVEAADFTSNAAVVIPGRPLVNGAIPLRIYGGFDVSITCPGGACQLGWRRGTNRTRWERQAPASVDSNYPYGRSYAALEGDPASAVPTSVLLDGFVFTTAAPDPSSYLSRGQHAPDQIGFRCPISGCLELELTHTDFVIEAGARGGDGETGVAGPTSIDQNGRDGCVPGTNCSNQTSFEENEWMQYWWPGNYRDLLLRWFTDGLRGVAPTGCGDGARNHGGTSAAIRYREAVGQNRYYELVGGYGYNASNGDWNPRQTWDFGVPAGTAAGGYCYLEEGSRFYGAFAQNGADGSGGAGASVAFGRGVESADSRPELRRPWVTSARAGTSGNGGGGGAGCIRAGNDFYTCPCGGDARGGGGGAGGCSGFAGRSGGHGGSTIALLLTSPATASVGDLRLVTRDTLTLNAGRGGTGGRGGNGGGGAGGGRGGANPTSVPDGRLHGGSGGNGGGGGGGAGGSGGASLGIVRWCQRGVSEISSGCGITLPPLMLAAPANFITVAGAGAGGPGGTGGTGGIRAGSTDQPSPATRGGDGQPGLSNDSALLQWYAL
ncbi:MAG: putative metal-binding motif-containing protein [Myxococcota bacterium]